MFRCNTISNIIKKRDRRYYIAQNWQRFIARHRLELNASVSKRYYDVYRVLLRATEVFSHSKAGITKQRLIQNLVKHLRWSVFPK